RFARPARLHQHAALEQHVVFAVAVPVLGVGPLLDDAVMFKVGHRLDVTVDPKIDAGEILPGRSRKHHVARHAWLAGAVIRILAAEIDPSDRRPGRVAERDKQRTIFSIALRRCDERDKSKKTRSGPQPQKWFDTQTHVTPSPVFLGSRFSQSFFSAAKPDASI